MALSWVMKNLIGHTTWDKDATEDQAGQRDHWRDAVTVDIKQLNFKVNLLLKRFEVLIPPPLPLMPTT